MQGTTIMCLLTRFSKILAQYASIAVILAVAITSGGCASGTSQAYQTAADSEDPLYNTALVTSELFNALQREAGDLAEALCPPPDPCPAYGQRIINRMAEVELEVRPAVLELRSVAETYNAVRSASNEQELQAALNEAAILVTKFLTTVRRQ